MARRLPTDHLAATELVDLFKTGLQRSRVRAGETVLIYGDSNTRPHYLAAFMGAALALEANAVQLIVPSTSPAVQPFAPHTEALGRSLMARAWKAADLVVDATTGAGQLYSKITKDALTSGTRVLRVTATIDELQRMAGTPELKTRVQRSRDILLKGTTLHITSEAGTDLTMDKSGRRVSYQYGMADEPGRWTMWNGGQVATAPLEDSAEGRLVVNVGDILLPLGRYVSDPIACIIQDGRITEIQGKGVDTFLLRDWFASWDDPNAYIVSHIGWGCHKGADWNRMGKRWLENGGLMDCESFYGNMQIAFGNNISFTLGGENFTRAHIDIDTRHHSFYVDGVLILDRGEFALNALH